MEVVWEPPQPGSWMKLEDSGICTPVLRSVEIAQGHSEIERQKPVASLSKVYQVEYSRCQTQE